jgi:protein-S-isoprenylcysteine O-methyltransferase Ste14
VSGDAHVVTYWDTSAVLSALFRDEHSERALAHSCAAGTHLLSSLAWAEAYAVIARLERERAVATVLADAAREVLETGPWRRVNVVPGWNAVRSLAKAWPLRGADLWHLAAAKELKADLPELSLLTFDARLTVAAQGEGLSP